MPARGLACLLAAALAALAGREHIQLLGQLANARADLAAERARARTNLDAERAHVDQLRAVIALAPYARQGEARRARA